MAKVFVPDAAAMEYQFHSWPGIVGVHITKKTMKLQALSVKSAPKPGKRPRNRTMINYSTGRLASTIIMRRDKFRNELEGRVIALAKHAVFVHEGTAPHIIRPKRARYLKFFWHKVGHVVHLKQVNHPGTRPIPFMTENLREAIR